MLFIASAGWEIQIHTEDGRSLRVPQLGTRKKLYVHVSDQQTWCPLCSEVAQKPVGGAFGLFKNDYFRDHGLKGGQAALKEVAAAWKNLDQESKAAYKEDFEGVS
jgi:hypothetical protein